MTKCCTKAFSSLNFFVKSMYKEPSPGADAQTLKKASNRELWAHLEVPPPTSPPPLPWHKAQLVKATCRVSFLWCMVCVQMCVLPSKECPSTSDDVTVRCGWANKTLVEYRGGRGSPLPPAWVWGQQPPRTQQRRAQRREELPGQNRVPEGRPVDRRGW